MSGTTHTVLGMNKPPGRYEVTVRVAPDDGHPPDPARFAVTVGKAASSRTASVVSAHTAEEIICIVCVAAPDRCPLSCGGSKNTVCRSWSWQLLQVTRTCPMPRPRSAASRAGSQMHGVQLTCALPGHSW